MINNTRKAAKSDFQYSDHSVSGRNGVSSIQDLGAVLRERREAMGVSLAEVEVATRIRQKYLSALESDEWHLLPGEVVGRGFLRNYADYLGLEPNEVIDRRRAVADSNLSAALLNTSAGSPLPPEREVDYRPKEVDLKDEVDGIQRGEIKLTPILTIVGVAVLVLVVWWGARTVSRPVENLIGNMRSGVAATFIRPTATTTASVMGVVNAQNLSGQQTSMGVTPITNAALNASSVVDNGTAAAGIAGDSANENSGAAAGSAPQTGNGETLLLPTNTPIESANVPAQANQPADPPTPLPPTPTSPPPPTDTPLPPPPTDTPAPPTDTPAPAVVAAACSDSRAAITGPGMNQVLRGVANVSGTAMHDAFQFYKLEYAAGANASSGFVYFDGRQEQVNGGLLGNLDTRTLPNGDYTIRLTVVDKSGNFPPPCDVTVSINN